MTRLEVRLDDTSLADANVRVGELTRTVSRTGEAVRFRYDASWLSHGRAFALEPALPLLEGDQHPPAGHSLHAAFLDMSPDRWGRVLMERREAMEANDAGRPMRVLRDFDFLVGVNDGTRMGALRLFDPASGSYVDARELGAPPLARLRELEAIVAALDRGDAETRAEYRQWLQALVLPGTSLGGARPKASFTDDDGSMWLAKFPAADDRRDVGLLEFLATTLARDAGIDVVDVRRERYSERGHTFMAKRFDRVAGSRRAFASAMTLLQRRDGDGGSYPELAELVTTIAPADAIEAQLEQLYRRVLFNVLIGNRDDHWRNHGFLRTPRGWVQSPAYDLVPNPDRDVHAIAIDEGDPRPDSARLRATAAYYRLRGTQLERVEREVRGAVAQWRVLARRLHVSALDQQVLATVIDPDR